LSRGQTGTCIACKQIRHAVTDDAVTAGNVSRRSITQLCIEDHGNDPGNLARWLANKTPAHLRAGIASTKQSPRGAVNDDAIFSVGWA
jgi:hypothetical protein